jgi:ATP-dependent Clp protease adapter protein ClpS
MRRAGSGGGTIVLPERQESLGVESDEEYVVIVHDNPVNTFDEVIAVLMLATDCPLAEAEMETWEVHHLGKSLVHHAERPECERVASVIRTIGIKVEVRPL